MADFTTEQVLALVSAARRDDDGDEPGDGGSGPGAGGTDPTPTRDDVPETVRALAREFAEDSGCTVTWTPTDGGGIIVTVTDCPDPPSPDDDDNRELEESLLRAMVEEAAKAGRSIRINRDSAARKPNDPVERLDRKLALREAAAAAFGDLLAQAVPEDLTPASRDACLSISTRLLGVPGKEKLQAAFGQFGGLTGDSWTPEQVAQELLTLSAYLKAWVASQADGVLKGAGLPDVDREFWTAIRDAARAGR